MVGLGALPPVDAANRVARLVAAELPEGLADANPPAPMNALRDRGGNLFRRDLQGRQPAGGLLRRVTDLEPGLAHAPVPMMDVVMPFRTLIPGVRTTWR